MKIVSFNVNGLRARLHQLEAMINKHQPDIIGLQETKVEDSLFPVAAINALGYEVLFHGQKGHYGVAMLYRMPIANSMKGLPTDTEDSQKRLVYCAFSTDKSSALKGQLLHVYNGYFPQGESRDHPTKFANKQNFYADLTAHIVATHQPGDAVVVMGDINIAPRDQDIGIGDDNKKRWLRSGKCSFLPEEREWLSTLTNWGLSDSFAELTASSPTDTPYSWFDYRSRGFERDPKRGLRIDVVLVTAPLLALSTEAGIDYPLRALEKPSDHCPIWLSLDT